MEDDTLAKYASVHYFDPREKVFLGRNITTIATVINSDLELASKQQFDGHEKTWNDSSWSFNLAIDSRKYASFKAAAA